MGRLSDRGVSEKVFQNEIAHPKLKQGCVMFNEILMCVFYGIWG
jgi:hypothetical protein